MVRAGILPRRGALSDWQVYRRLLRWVAPHWLFFLLSLAGYAVYSLGVVLLADLMQFLLDALGEPASAGTGIISGTAYAVFDVPADERVPFVRVAVPCVLVGLTLVRALGFFGGSYCISLVARNLVHDLRCALFDKMLAAPSTYYDRHSRGSLVSRITFNVEQVTGAATKALKTILRESLVVVGLVAYLLYLNWQLCLVFLVVVPLIAHVVSRVGRHFRRYSRRIQSSMGDVTQAAAQAVALHRELRLFAAQASQRRRFRAASEHNRRQSLKLAFAEAVSTPLIQVLLALALAVLVWFALSPAVLSGFSPGSLVAFLVAAVQLGKPLRQLSGVQSVLQQGLAAAEDIFLQLDSESERDTGTVDVSRVRGAIAVRDLSFTYPGAERPALRDVSMDITPGETVAVVGPSGSGKSTLAGLLARLYDAPVGTIRLDGVPVEDYRLASLRAQLALVTHDPPLLRDTVYNNIAMGASASPTRDAVARAAELAGCLEFVDRLPDGLHTGLGEDGGGLSAGQRQRVGLARALIKDAPVLILDEATAALDNASQSRIQRLLEQNFKGKSTVISVAHRLDILKDYDKIAVLKSGVILEIGSYQELIAKKGAFYELVYGRQ